MEASKSKSKATATVLIVEDELLLNEAYNIILKKEGFKTVSAHDGNAALKVLEDGNKVDLMLLDLRMPHMSGIELLKKIKKEKGITLPRTIVFSNYDVQRDIDEAFSYGATRYMLKSWASPKELVKVVRETLSQTVANPAAG